MISGNRQKMSPSIKSPKDYFAKAWDPAFLTTRTHRQDVSYVESKRHVDAHGKSIELFLRDGEDDTVSLKWRELKSFCQDVGLEDIKRGAGAAGYRRAAWLDDRSFPHESESSNVPGRGLAREIQNPLTATGLYRQLQPIANKDYPTTRRRLICIHGLDPGHIIALAETVTFHEVPTLRDAMKAHLAFETSVRVKISGGAAYSTFRLEIHMPFFALRESKLPETHGSHIKLCQAKASWIDVSFLSTQTSISYESEPEWGIYKSRFSFVICGSSDQHWTGYAFEECDDEGNFIEDCSDQDYGGYSVDPISDCDANQPVWNPRDYFLLVLERRVRRVLKEWEEVVYMVECKTKSHKHYHWVTELIPTEEAFDWITRTMALLGHLIEVLSKTIDTWERFKSPDGDGDIGYFQESSPDPPKSKSDFSERQARRSLRSINEYFSELERLRHRLRLLNQSCDTSWKALQLRHTAKTSKASQHTANTSEFAVLVVYPFALATGFFIMPQSAIPFRPSFKSFIISVFVFMVIFNLLFSALSRLMRGHWWPTSKAALDVFRRPFSGDNTDSNAVLPVYGWNKTPKLVDSSIESHHEPPPPARDNSDSEATLLDDTAQRSEFIPAEIRSPRRCCPNSGDWSCSHYVNPYPSDKMARHPPDFDQRWPVLDGGFKRSQTLSVADVPRQIRSESTASSEAYREADITSEEEPNVVSATKEKSNDRTMIELYSSFDTTLGARNAAPGQSNSAHGNPTAYRGFSSTMPSQQSTGKRAIDGDDGRGDDEEQDGNSHKKSRFSRVDDFQPARNLACPYFKHNPTKYRNTRLCLGPGWPDINRLKEHLYRRHALPPRCLRCCEIFDDDSDLTTHLRLPEGCKIQDVDPPEGFDNSQLKRLRSKKKDGKNREDLWKHVYSILFPNAVIPFPSPYYDYMEDYGQHLVSSASSVSYDAYLRRQLPQIVQQELVSEFEKKLSFVDESLKNEVPNIVRSCLERAFRTYQEKALKATDDQTHELKTSVAGSSKMAEINLCPRTSLQTAPRLCEVAPENTANTCDDLVAMFDTNEMEPADPADWWQDWSQESNSEMRESNIHFSTIGQSYGLSSLNFRSESPRMEEMQPSSFPHHQAQTFEDLMWLESTYTGKGKGKAN